MKFLIRKDAIELEEDNDCEDEFIQSAGF